MIRISFSYYSLLIVIQSEEELYISMRVLLSQSCNTTCTTQTCFQCHVTCHMMYTWLRSCLTPWVWMTGSRENEVRERHSNKRSTISIRVLQVFPDVTNPPIFYGSIISNYSYFTQNYTHPLSLTHSAIHCPVWNISHQQFSRYSSQLHETNCISWINTWYVNKEYRK